MVSVAGPTPLDDETPLDPRSGGTGAVSTRLDHLDGNGLSRGHGAAVRDENHATNSKMTVT